MVSASFEAMGDQGGLAEAQSESWSQFRARVKAKAWLPDGYDGWVLKKVPAFFYNTVGVAGWAVGQSISWLCTHMLAFFAAFVVSAIAVALWFIFS